MTANQRLTNSNFTDDSVDNRVLNNTDDYIMHSITSTYADAVSANYLFLNVINSAISYLPAYDLFNGVVFRGSRSEFYCTPANTNQDIHVNGGDLVFSRYYKTYNEIVINIDATPSFRIDVIGINNLNQNFVVIKGVDGLNEIPMVGADIYPIAVIKKTVTGIIQNDIHMVFNYFKSGHDEGVLTTTIASSGFIPLPTSTTRTLAATGMSAIDTTLYVVDTTDFPNSGLIKIGSEYIKYTSKTKNSFVGCTRGYDNSVASTHSVFDIVKKAFDQDQCEWIAMPRVVGDTSLTWAPSPEPPNYPIGYWMFNFKCYVDSNRLATIYYDTAFHVNRNIDSVMNVYIRGHEII